MKRHLNRCRFEHGLSREKAIQKSLQLFWIANIKIKFPLNIARANASAIPNRPIISIILFR